MRQAGDYKTKNCRRRMLKHRFKQVHKPLSGQFVCKPGMAFSSSIRNFNMQYVLSARFETAGKSAVQKECRNSRLNRCANRKPVWDKPQTEKYCQNGPFIELAGQIVKRSLRRLLRGRRYPASGFVEGPGSFLFEICLGKPEKTET